MHHLLRSFELKLASAQTGVFEGYGSIFGNQDSYDDIVASGAFKRSLAEHAKNGSMPAMLYQHNPEQPIGVWTKIEEDSKGLRVAGQLAMKTQLGAETYQLLEMKALRGLSIGYTTVKAAWDEKAQTRTLMDVDLWEVSAVTFGANTEALIDTVKSTLAKGALGSPDEFERFLREAGMTRSQAKALMAGGYKGLLHPIEQQHEEQAAIAQKLRDEEIRRLTKAIRAAIPK